ncbi:hypothetical protein PSN45_002586 [Yamadazyma tenuis]|uniref:PCI domain-containing protein n=1 Tax=Candida tenuis (strain ATCC 10573 / BCRC 21748 / CBS 615 / JCM 9827 / NBRC 10315 / NRRL Y-1498 / VKM Y-70) TaxID=590646 RepID=G3AZX8_CANTC|nr:uncharacterized protein CANTEDRAFT_113005 [Yamadazyma tenuis ATCC 10573]EGV65268.1 hypothetical protein CANTEDRAFT_113005 [Yamadazyma tenuis ATCC 10573]WEJ95077.1 hypothetical protein PSN45_002586 [Yamadazyma tenuis]
MSVFVVDNEITSSVRELGEIIDTIKGSSDFSQSLDSHIPSSPADFTDKSALIQKVYDASSPEYLKTLSDKEFEPTFNLIIYILSALQGGVEAVFAKDTEDKLLNNLINSSPVQQLSLRDRKSIKATSILSELTLVFNLLPSTSSIRVKVVTLILSFVKKLELDFSILQQSFGENLVSWLQEAQASEKDIKQVFWSFIELDSSRSSKSLELINKFTKQYQLDQQELQSLIKFALNGSTIDLSFMVNNNVNKAIQAHQSDALVALFSRYLQGELLEDSPDFTNLKSKSQILALCKFFETSSKFEFNLAEIPVASSTDLEVLLINSIKAGLVEGKLDQTNSTFYLTRINKFILPSDQQAVARNLEGVKSHLAAWRASLVSVGDVVNTFRENIK